MKFEDIAKLKQKLKSIPNQSVLFSNQLIVEVKDGDIVSIPSKNKIVDVKKKGYYALIEYISRYTSVEKKQAIELADELIKDFINMKYAYTMKNLNGEVTTFETLNGIRFTKTEYGYRIYKKIYKQESDIEHGHRYCFYKDDTGLYESYYTNEDGFKTLTDTKKDKQLSIFDFE